jgi:hypothetical protein
MPLKWTNERSTRSAFILHHGPNSGTYIALSEECQFQRPEGPLAPRRLWAVSSSLHHPQRVEQRPRSFCIHGVADYFHREGSKERKGSQAHTDPCRGRPQALSRNIIRWGKQQRRSAPAAKGVLELLGRHLALPTKTI